MHNGKDIEKQLSDNEIVLKYTTPSYERFEDNPRNRTNYFLNLRREMTVIKSLRKKFNTGKGDALSDILGEAIILPFIVTAASS